MKFNLLTVACASVVCTAANAATIQVPRHYASIQQAIDAAAPGDVVSVDPGTYRETLVIVGKDLRLECSSSAGTVVIDGDERFRCMECHDVTAATSISGFTFQDGVSPVLYEPSSFPADPQDEYDFRLSMRGGGVLLHKADVQFGNCSFISNKAFEGGALYSWMSKPSFDSCSFEKNGMGNLEDAYWNPGSCAVINTLGRGTATFNQCEFKDGFGGRGNLIFYPLELDGRRVTVRPRRANESAVRIANSTVEGSILSRTNLEVENSQFTAGWLYGHNGIYATDGTSPAHGQRLDWTIGDRAMKIYSPRSGQWTVSVSGSTFSYVKSAFKSDRRETAIYIGGRNAVINDVSIENTSWGIQVWNGSLISRDCEFDNLDHAIYGNGSTLELESCNIINCASVLSDANAYTWGAAMYLYDCECTMTDSLVENCYADLGILRLADTNFRGDSNEVRDCKAVDGAVLMASGDSRVESMNSTYSGCMTVTDRRAQASAWGTWHYGVFSIYYDAEFVSINDTYVDLHSKKSEDPGCNEAIVYCGIRSDVTYEGLSMSRCTAESGDLICVDGCGYGANLYLENCQIHDNIAGAKGHVVAKRGPRSELHIFECEFACNVARPKPGGPGLNAVVYSYSWHDAKLASVADTHFCGNKMTAFDGPWTDNGGVTFSRRCTSP